MDDRIKTDELINDETLNEVEVSTDVTIIFLTKDKEKFQLTLISAHLILKTCFPCSMDFIKEMLNKDLSTKYNPLDATIIIV